jgi:non-ribosomal peptide synthetase component F/thioesterase domain-containing protein
MTDISKRVAGLSPEKIRLLSQQLGKKGARPAVATIPRQPRDTNRFPLSYAQRMIWFLHQLAPQSPAYNNFLTVRVVTEGGELRPAMMEKVMNEIIRRHESMRTSFVTVDGEPVQVVNTGAALTVPVLDLTGVAADLREAEALRLVREEYRRPFDIEQAPLVRLTLLRLSATESIITFVTHHLISDGWSQGIFLRENAILSGAFMMGMPSPLPELPVQYADYAVWQEEFLKGPRFAEMLGYWKNKLAGTLPILQLPADRPRPLVQDYEGKTVYRTLPASLANELRAFAKREQASLYQTLLAGLNVLFHRYTGDDDIVIGSPVANRTRPEIENIYGFFVNTLALRTTFTRDHSFRALLAAVRETCEGALANQEMPFEKLVEELAPKRDLRFNPLFQTMFALQNAPMEVKSPGVTLIPMRVANDTAKFDVGLWAEEMDNGELLLSLGYRTALFDDAPMERMLAHYEQLLRDAVARPEARIATLRLEETAATASLPPANDAPLFLDLFAASVQAVPEQIAVTGFDGTMTYAQLDAEAERIAAALGVVPDALVAIRLPRGTRAIAAILGILKAGAAYLPIDLDLPEERVAMMLAAAQPAAVIDEEWLRTCTPHREAHAAPRPENLAYAIFTSGSTGTPKCVAIEHRNLANYIDGILPRLAGTPTHPGMAGYKPTLLGTEEGGLIARHPRAGGGHSPNATTAPTFATVSTLAADLGHTMIFPALASGGTLHVVPQECVTDPKLLAEWFDTHPADFLKIVPSHLDSLLAAGDPARILPKRTLVLGGEAASEQLIRTINTAAPSLRILNHYGPTETTVGVLTYDVPQTRTQTSNDTMPLGFPLPGTTVRIVDTETQPLPDGVPGELLIGGHSVGRGYLGLAEATAERFLDADGIRFYRSGDRVRRLAGGAIQFLGRVDHQVKIRGHRIELGEIEAALRAHPSVFDAAVVLRDGRLHGYVASPDDTADAGELRAYLRSRLPEVMVPAALLVMDALPLNANGKVDRRALPAITGDVRDTAAPFVAPRNGLELSIARVWEEMLDVRPIGVTDNFFDLGGHSLLAVRVAARVAKELSIEVPIATMFQAGTIERLAQSLGGSVAPAALTTVVPIQPEGTNPPLFFIHPAGGNVLCYYDLSRQLGTDQPFYGLQVSDFSAGRELRSIEEMAAEYIAAMREVQPHGPYHLGGWSMGGVVAFEMARQLGTGNVALLTILDMSIPLGNVDGASDLLDDEARAIAIYAQKLELFSGMRLGIDYAGIAAMDPAERVARFARELQKTGLVPKEIGAEALGRFLAFQQGHSRVTLQYTPSPIDAPVTLIRGSEPLELRDQVDLAGLAALHDDPALGWQPFTTHPVDVRRVPGNHITMMTRPNVRTLAATLAAVMAEAKETRHAAV